MSINAPVPLSKARKIILSKPENSHVRQRYCLAYMSLCKIAGLENDFKDLMGNYSSANVTPRDIPPDDVIIKYFSEIKNPKWAWVYGMLATYGLRNHEVFHVDLQTLIEDEDSVICIKDGKTGQRDGCCPLWPHWVELFDLKNPKVPACNGTNVAFGARVTGYFNKIEAPFSPYNLRHAWAIRSLEAGMDITIAAMQMGHSVQIHNNTYHNPNFSQVGEQDEKGVDLANQWVTMTTKLPSRIGNDREKVQFAISHQHRG